MHRCSTTIPFIAALAFASALTACVTPPVVPEIPRLDAEAAVEQANNLIGSGQTSQAIVLLDQAAKDNPVSARPWLRRAQLQFDQSDYPAAIVSAEEAVKRDPANQEARSIAVVASLRIAIRSLTELRGEQNLNASAQAEAQRLASVLRESLSADLLLPPPPAPEPAKKPAKRPVAKRPAPITVPAAPAATASSVSVPPPPTTPDNGDPFGALRNN